MKRLLAILPMTSWSAVCSCCGSCDRSRCEGPSPTSIVLAAIGALAIVDTAARHFTSGV